MALSKGEELMQKVQETQTAFWDALRELEVWLDIEIDDTQDFAGMTCEDLIEQEGEK